MREFVVSAHVRIVGSLGSFESRRFWFAAETDANNETLERAAFYVIGAAGYEVERVDWIEAR